jgi:hypothetical protein
MQRLAALYHYLTIVQRGPSSFGEGLIVYGASKRSQSVYFKGPATQICAEAESLKLAHDSAMRACRLYRVMLLDGSLKDDGHLRKQLLEARRRAADRLYKHSLHCSSCNPARPSDEGP